jgi:hypothetical protein
MSVKRATLNGRQYLIEHLLHSQAREVFTILLRNLGPAAGEALVSIAQSGGSLSGMSPTALGRAVQDVCLRLNNEDLARVSELFGERTTVIDGNAKTELTAKKQDLFFSGRMAEWAEWMSLCVEHNYADFLGLLTRATNSQSAAPDTSETA